MNKYFKYLTRKLRRKTLEERAFILFPKIYPEVIQGCEYAPFDKQIGYNDLENKMATIADDVADKEQHTHLTNVLLSYMRRPQITHTVDFERDEDKQIAFEVGLKNSPRPEDQIFYEIYIRNKYRYEHVVTAATCLNEYLDKLIAIFHNPEEVCEEKSDRLIRRKLKLSPTEPLDTYAQEQKEAIKIKLLKTGVDDMLRVPPKFISSAVINARAEFIANFHETAREYFENPGSGRDKSKTTDALEDYITILINWYCQVEGGRISILIKGVEEANPKVVKKHGAITEEKLRSPNNLLPAV